MSATWELKNVHKSTVLKVLAFVSVSAMLYLGCDTYLFANIRYFFLEGAHYIAVYFSTNIEMQN